MPSCVLRDIDQSCHELYTVQLLWYFPYDLCDKLFSEWVASADVANFLSCLDKSQYYYTTFHQCIENPDTLITWRLCELIPCSQGYTEVKVLKGSWNLTQSVNQTWITLVMTNQTDWSFHILSEMYLNEMRLIERHLILFSHVYNWLLWPVKRLLNLK